MRRAVIILAAAGAVGACAPEVETGRADFLAFCSSCHGLDGAGDGLAAGGLETPPPDLTRIAARNGGVFDFAAVMSQVDGYTRDDAGQVMPDFGDLLRGDRVLVDLGDGILTPTPQRLVALAEYLQSIQAPAGG